MWHSPGHLSSTGHFRFLTEFKTVGCFPDQRSSTSKPQNKFETLWNAHKTNEFIHYKDIQSKLVRIFIQFFEWRLECCLQCPCNISWFWAQQNFHQHPALWCVFCLLVLIEDAAGIRTLVPHLTSLLHVTLRELPGMTLRSLLVEYLEPAITITFHTCLPQRPKRNKLVPLHRKKLSY